MFIAVDFDGTIVEHRFPDIGAPVPGAIEWMKRWQQAGVKLILWTMRSDGPKNGPVLTQAVEYCRRNGIELYGVNANISQYSWSDSPKAYAHLYVDDSAFGCPLRQGGMLGHALMVDWDVVGPAVLRLIQEKVVS